MANILFKRGLHTGLPTGANVIDGAFYLTTDTHRLYAGIKAEGKTNADLVDLNQYITLVDKLENLPDPYAQGSTVELGDFAYIQDGNILAVCTLTDPSKAENQQTNPRHWVQVNKTANNINASFTAGVKAGTTDTLTLTVTDDKGKKVTSEVKFIGESGIGVEVDSNGQVTITGDPYTLSGALEDNKLTITLDSEGDEASSVTLVAGENINFTEDADGNTVIKTHAPTKLQSASVAVNGENATITVADSTGKSVSGTAEKALYMTYGGGAEKVRASNQGYMKVYTIDEIDNMMKGLNPMSYCGTVSEADDIYEAEGIHIGDTFMAADAFIVSVIDGVVVELNSPDSTSITTKTGDLFIATIAEGKTEVNGVIPKADLVWTYIPAGDDSQRDTTYNASENEDGNFTVKNDRGQTLFTIIPENTDKKIAIDTNFDTNSKKWTVNIDHAEAEVDKDSMSTISNQTSITYYADVDCDETGHLKTAKKRTANLMTYTLDDMGVSSSNNSATITTTMKNSEGKTVKAAAYSLTGVGEGNITVTSDETDVSIAMTWGSF